LVDCATTGQGAIYAFPFSIGADVKAVDALVCGVAGGIDSIIAAEIRVKGNGY